MRGGKFAIGKDCIQKGEFEGFWERGEDMGIFCWKFFVGFLAHESGNGLCT